MALAKTANGITSIHGSCGGVYFKKDSSGQHIQAMPRSIRKISMESPVIAPSSPGSRAAWIAATSDAAWAWLIVAALGFLPYWKDFMDAYLYEGNTGLGQKRISHYNWFMHFNISRKARRKIPWIRPPKSPSELPDAVSTSEYPDMEYTNFYVRGTYNGKTLYESQNGQWFCWWLDPSWIISIAPGNSSTPPYWFRLFSDEHGDYEPVEPLFKTTWFHD